MFFTKSRCKRNFNQGIRRFSVVCFVTSPILLSSRGFAASARRSFISFRGRLVNLHLPGRAVSASPFSRGTSSLSLRVVFRLFRNLSHTRPTVIGLMNTRHSQANNERRTKLLTFIIQARFNFRFTANFLSQFSPSRRAKDGVARSPDKADHARGVESNVNCQRSVSRVHFVYRQCSWLIGHVFDRARCN